MSDNVYPLVFTWEGDVMRPLNSLSADRNYVVGETYRLAPYEERSINSHNHYFACIAEAHRNLPDDLAARFPTTEHLRKHALIQTGYRDERSIVCATKAEALRVAAFIRPMDEYAVVIVREAVVLHLTAKSQSLRAMGKELFQKSKWAVLDEISKMIGVSRETLQENAGRAA